MENACEAPGVIVEIFFGKFWCDQQKWGKFRSRDKNIRLEIPGANEYIIKRYN